MKEKYTRRGETQNEGDVYNKSHSRGILAGIFNACRCNKKGKAECVSTGMRGHNNKVILNLFQDLQRNLLLLINDMRGRFRIKHGMTLFNKGFTLIEMLVVVLIIGILAAVALPQYQKAVLKSRFVSMMPVAKTLAGANEVYYAEHDAYATDPARLNITRPAETPDGTRVLLNDNSGLSYVSVMNDNIPNAEYVVYQKNSENFAGATMCEAGDERARELCLALGGTPLNGTSTRNANWTAYLLGEAGQTGTFPPVDLIASQSHAKGTAVLVNGQWEYEWSDGSVYGDGQSCIGSSAYDCAGSTFSGKNSWCRDNTSNACVGSIFSGEKSYCAGVVPDACSGLTFSGKNSYCWGNSPSACAGSIFSGEGSWCDGSSNKACMGSEIQAGAYCQPYRGGGCAGALYGSHPDKDPNLIGSCDNVYGLCPTGVPLRGDWNATNGSYDISGWKGDCCNPAYMVSGECPAGITVCPQQP